MMGSGGGPLPPFGMGGGVGGLGPGVGGGGGSGREKLVPINDVHFSREQMNLLCELYEREDDLWNMTKPEYRKKDARQRALERIVLAMNGEFTGKCTSHAFLTPCFCRLLRALSHALGERERAPLGASESRSPGRRGGE